jgi:hypothetical protein
MFLLVLSPLSVPIFASWPVPHKCLMPRLQRALRPLCFFFFFFDWISVVPNSRLLAAQLWL